MTIVDQAGLLLVLVVGDLSGLKVAHDAEEFEEGEHILTLKDSRILDGEGTSTACICFLVLEYSSTLFFACFIEDELTNTDLARAEFDRKKAELKKANKGYTGYDDDEFDPSMSTVGMKKKVLTKYDVDIEGESDSVGSATFYVGSLVYEVFTLGFLFCRALDWVERWLSRRGKQQTTKMNYWKQV